jgi:hypothetical protein
MDRKDFLSVVGAAPLMPAPTTVPAAIGVNDLRLLVTVGGVNRIGVLVASSAFLFLSAQPGQLRILNVPRPTSEEDRWNVIPPPSTPIVNPAYRSSDVVYDAAPDAVTASTPYRTGAVFAFKPRSSSPYLVYVVPSSTSFAVRALQRGGDVRALFLGPDGMHVVFNASPDGQVVIPLPVT